MWNSEYLYLVKCFLRNNSFLKVKMYMKSDLFQKKVTNMEKAKRAAQEISNKRKRTHDEAKAAQVQIKQSKIDATEICTAKEESNQFLRMALKLVLHF